MGASDWIAIAALIVSIIAAVKSFVSARYNKTIRLVELEKSFLDRIVEARFRYSEVIDKIGAIQFQDEDTKSVLRSFINDRLEEYLNSIDYACDKYIRNMLDKESFIEVFGTQIREALDNQTLYDIVMNGDQNRFKSIKKVYQLINN